MIACLPLVAMAQEHIATQAELPAAEERWNAKFQTTYIWQQKQSFNAPYSGANSLSSDRAITYSFSGTGYFGLRPWAGGEIYFDPEMIQAVPLSDLHGLGGLNNSEQQKSSGANPKFYKARLYLKQTLGFGGGSEAVESGQNQLAGVVDKRRLVITAGNLSVLDIFDNNAYAHDARTQFTNWSFLTYGAFDYAADVRGYSVGAAAEYYDDDWALRVGRFMVPVQSNGAQLDGRIGRHFGEQLEIEHAHVIDGQPGKVRLLGFLNQENMGGFADAIGYARVNGGVPDVSNVRKEQIKLGYGISLEQSLRSDIGVFGRASWNDGKTETYSFTEIENAVSAGVTLKGERWGRSQDTVGLAVAQNGLNKAHRDYLALGGLGAFIGDGQINYRPERIAEVYYNANLFKSTSLMVGFQHIVNPAYNADRGSVNFVTLRGHSEF